MNFKIICLLILSTGCGVKGPPKPPAGTSVPSYVNKYLKKDIGATSESKGTDKSKKKEADNNSESN